MSAGPSRREFVAALAGLPCAARIAEGQAVGPVPIIDAHIHLFDKTRPEGAPWPYDLTSPPGATALPARFKPIVKPFGVVGAIVIEAAARIEDNQWYLDLAEVEPMIVGVVGRIDCNQPDFGRHLERFRKNRMFLGIRQARIAEGLEKPAFVSNLKLLADANLSLDTFIMTGGSEGLVHLTDRIPSLRMIIDHMPGVRLSENRVERDSYVAALEELGKRPQVYMKFSEVVKSVDGKVSTDLSVYRDWLDQLWDMFGENRSIFASDWPNSENVEPNSYPNVIAVARAYLGGKGRTAMEKVFWRNSIPAYRWVRRDSTQPQA